MKCKKHPADPSSGVGICATCLRERLFAVIVAQTQKGMPPPPAPPLSFPRSVSPYVSRRKSDTAAARRGQSRHRGFFSTPQVGPAGEVEEGRRRGRSKSGRIISLFLGFFRSKSGMPDSSPDPDSCSVSVSTPWFYPSFIAGRRKVTGSCSTAPGPQQRKISIHHKYCDRGMSPVRCPDDGEYSSKPTPRSTPARGRRSGRKPGTPSKSVSELRFCLSPLVRASPNRQRNQRGVAPEMWAAGEVRAAAKPCMSAAASFCKNRSRKLADLGRFG